MRKLNPATLLLSTRSITIHWAIQAANIYYFNIYFKILFVNFGCKGIQGPVIKKLD